MLSNISSGNSNFYSSWFVKIRYSSNNLPHMYFESYIYSLPSFIYKKNSENYNSSLCCIYRYIQWWVVIIMLFEFGKYCFIKLLKWKFKFWNFLSENSKLSIFDRSKLWLDWNFGSIDWNGKKIILEFLDVSIIAWFLFNRLKKVFDRSKGIFDWANIKNQDFSTEFSGDCLESLERFQALWTVLWNILTLYTCLLIKYNPMGINRGLYSLVS